MCIIGVDFLHSHQLSRCEPPINTTLLQAFATVSAPTAAACAACRGNQQDSKVSPSSAAAAVVGPQDSRLSPSPTIAAGAARVDSRNCPPSAPPPLR
jgi:hypothetical protein